MAFTDVLNKEDKFRLPRHIALVTKGKHDYAKSKDVSIGDVYKKSNVIILNIMESTIKLGVPITTFYLLSTESEELEHFSSVIDSLTDFFNSLGDNEVIHNNKIKVSVLGKWYDMPGKLVDAIKGIIEKTKEYDSYFVNFCVNYNGKEEIVDAVKLIARKLKAEKIDPEMITKEVIKDNLYSSYFVPPELVVVNGSSKVSDLLLWDLPNSKVYFTKKLWLEFEKKDLLLAIRSFQKEF